MSPFAILLIFLSPALVFPGCCLAQDCSNPAQDSDLVLFRNGDRLTGRVLSITRNSIAFHNPAVGSVSIPWTVVEQVQSTNAKFQVSATAPFHKAFVGEAGGDLNVAIDQGEKQTVPPDSTFELENPPCSQLSAMPLAQTPAQTRRAPAPSGANNFLWLFNINAPYTFTFGTENQETLGGMLTFDYYRGSLNHTTVVASGTHNRTWEAGSPFVTTDTFNAFLQQSRSLGPNRGGIYGKVETFFNTSLGMAMERSVGGGYYSRSIPRGPFHFSWVADLRYFNQRLYGTARTSNLVGSRLEGQVSYRKSDPSDKTKVKYMIVSRSWVNPMWNNQRALQGFTTLQLNVPFGRSVCLQFNPLEDDYMRNAPPGKRKNYLSSSVTLKIEHGSSPNSRCY